MFYLAILSILRSTTALILYSNAQFVPSNNQLISKNISQVNSLNNCSCLCFNDPFCLTLSYRAVAMTCTLYEASLDEGILRVISTDQMASVITFGNKILNPILASVISESIQAIWNTTIGQNSQNATSGYNSGNYVPAESPTNALDQSILTKYASYGTCSFHTGTNDIECGQKTGLYFTLQNGSFLVKSFRFRTADTFPNHDPIVITIEGSNQPPSLLNFGSSWTLIYNGTSGLDVDPGRLSFGITIMLLNNTARYSSYRQLVQSKRGQGNFVQYTEFELYVI